MQFIISCKHNNLVCKLKTLNAPWKRKKEAGKGSRIYRQLNNLGYEFNKFLDRIDNGLTVF